MGTLPRYIKRQVSRRRTYYYFRHGGRILARIPGAPGTAEFHAAYATWLAQIEDDPPPRRHADGSVGALIVDYKSAAEFRGLKPKTQRDYARMLDRLAPIADFPAEDIRRRHVRALLTHLADRPRAQKMLAQVASRLFTFGAENDYCVTNPAARFKRVGEADSYTPWPDTACAAFEASGPPLALLTGYMLARYTGQRLADCLATGPQHRRGQWIEVVQAKVAGVRLDIPLHARLTAHLDALPTDRFQYVARADGRAVHPNIFEAVQWLAQGPRSPRLPLPRPAPHGGDGNGGSWLHAARDPGHYRPQDARDGRELHQARRPAPPCPRGDDEARENGAGTAKWKTALTERKTAGSKITVSY